MEPGLDVRQGTDDDGGGEEGHGSPSRSSPQREPAECENSSGLQSATATAKPGRGTRGAGWCGPRTPEALCNAEEPSETGAANEGNQIGNSSGSHLGDSSANRKSDRTKKDRQISLHDDHGELDYDEDEDAAEDGDELGDHSNKEDNPDNPEESGGPSQEKESLHSPPNIDGLAKTKHDKEVKDSEKSDEGEIQDEDCEDGEIKDDEKRPFVRTQICRFFKRGHCTWGYNCRFLHPGVNDKGAYSLVDRPGLTAAFSKPITAEAMELVNVPPAVPPYISAAPKVETAWERGLRQAKEAMRRASRKKESETDLEYKKLSITLADAENKENDKKYKDPYYDDVDDVDITLVLDQSKRPASDTNLEQPRKNQWRVGNYENFEIRPSRDSYENRNDPRVKDPVPPPARYSLPKPPAQYETRGMEGPISPPQLPRRDRPSLAAPSQDNPKSSEPRGRDNNNGGQPSFANRADDWHDPWQRSRESRTRRRSATPDRRRRESRGSRSGSSGSSYSRSKSGSYSSSYSDGDSSRSSSASSASSRSSSKSRSRVASTRRAPPATDRTTAQAAPHSRKPLLQQPLLPVPPQQHSSAAAVGGGGSGRAQRGPRDDKPPLDSRRGRDEWPHAPGRSMPPPAAMPPPPVATRDGRSAPRQPESPSLGASKYQPFLISSTPNVKVPGRPGNDGLQKDHHPVSVPPSRPALLGKGPVRQRRRSSGSDSSRSISPPHSPAARQRTVPGGGSMPAHQKGSAAAPAAPQAFGSGGARADSFGMSPIHDRSSSPRSSASPRRADRGQRYRSRSPSGDDVYGDLDRVPYALPAAAASAPGGRAIAPPPRTNSKEAPSRQRPDDGQLAPPPPRDAGGGIQRQRVAPPLPTALPAQPAKARSTGEAPKAAAAGTDAPVPAGGRPVPKAGGAQPEQQPAAAGRIAGPPGAIQKTAIKLTLISKPQPINLGARKRSAINEGSLSPPSVAAPPPSKRPTLPFSPSDALALEKTGAGVDKAVARTAAKQGATASEPGSAAARATKLAGAPLSATAAPQPRPGSAALGGGGSSAGGGGSAVQPSVAAVAATAAIASAAVAGSGLSKTAATKKTTSSRREELLKQLKAVEDAIARKRSKV